MKKLGVILVILMLMLNISLFAQPPDTLWTCTFGGSANEEGYCVRQTLDGGFIITGYTMSFGAGQRDVYLIKTDSVGNLIWSKTYGGLDSDEAYSVSPTSDGGYIIAGETRSFGSVAPNIYLIKTDANGDTLWSRNYGENYNIDIGRCVQQTSDDGYIIAGRTRSFGAVYSDLFLIKTDAQGNVIWVNTYGGSDFDEGYWVEPTLDGGFILVGYTESFGAGDCDVYLVKTDAQGNVIWSKTYGGSAYDRGYFVQPTSDGGYVIVGCTMSFGQGSKDVYLIKTDPNGDTLWTRTYGGNEFEEGYSVYQTSDGGYIIGGYTFSFGSGSEDVYLIRVNSEGNVIWTQTYGGFFSDKGYFVFPVSQGGYIITGYTQSAGSGGKDVYLIRLAPDVSIKESLLDPENSFSLLGSNIFKDKITISYFLPQSVQLLIEIYNLNGQKVTTLVNERKEKGIHSISSLKISSGIYFLKIRAGKRKITKKIILFQ